MAAEETFEWPDWRAILDPNDPDASRRSLSDLARFANPAMVEGLGLGLGRSEHGGQESNFVEMAWLLADNLDNKKRLSWTVDAFNPTGPGQVIRTTSELLEGAGTCLDFAVTFAAMCVRERIPCTLVIAREEGSHLAHAFIAIEEPGDVARPYDNEICPVNEWIQAFEGAQHERAQIIDVTPPEGDVIDRPSVQTRSEELLQELRSISGHVFAVDVEAAVRASKAGWHLLPDTRRDLGLVGRLPDLPADHRDFETHDGVRKSLASAEGVIVLHGPSGTGKSTLALEHAITLVGGTGWFLDGSDERALRYSLANAEARSRGNRPMNLQTSYLESMTVAALQRLSATQRPWVVVIDNAEGEPSRLYPLVPATREGQLVIITTTQPGWESIVGKERVLEVEPLQGNDLVVEGSGVTLGKGEWLPGLRRIAIRSELDQDALASEQGTVVELVVRGALRMTGAKWPGDSMARAIAAASFMPAERITLGWLSESAFGGVRNDALNAIEKCIKAGFLEGSRQTFDVRARDEGPIWMHRLVRQTVRRLLPKDVQTIGWSVIEQYSSRRRTNHYTDDEVNDLCTFLEESVPVAPSITYGEAVQVILDMLESRGITMVERAATLAERAMSCVDPRASHRDARIASTILLARARAVNQRKGVTADKVRTAIEWCRQAELVLGDQLGTSDLLLAGRASAMRGVLLKRLASVDESLVPDDELGLLNEALEVLTESYHSRRRALEREAHTLGREVQDPEQHIDRGWYNLGGANVALANEVRTTEPQRVPQLLRDAMTAYAGSLDLRRNLELPLDNTFTAASLWGVALTAYSAALYCPNEFDLTGVAPIEELEAVMRSPSRPALLRAAEIAGFRALEMRAVVDSPTGGDAKKARDLLLKISMAWSVQGDTPPSRALESLEALESFFEDCDVTFAEVREAASELARDDEATMT
jgi:hypothetical protein